MKLAGINLAAIAMFLAASGAATIAAPALAQNGDGAPAADSPAGPSAAPVSSDVVPAVDVAPVWSVAQAEQLISFINGLDKDGLNPADYKPEALTAAILLGAGQALDAEFIRAFTWVAEDLRDGRT
ncbi:MAG: L,D-transpeptidase, partial [Sphingorhabdus sp.]|nr:L,D-transpeptidase [Sphingorhabdus sp.]